MELTSKSYLPGRAARHLQDSGREDQALKTQLIQRISSIFFVFLHLFFRLSFSILSVPTHLFHSSPIFSVSHSTGENPQSLGHTSISAKAKNIFFQSRIQRRNRIPTIGQHIPVYLLLPETSLHIAIRKTSYMCSIITSDSCLRICCFHYQRVSDDCRRNPGVLTPLGGLFDVNPSI